MNLRFFTVMMGLSVVFIGNLALGYEETTIEKGGTLSGMVRLMGEVPKPKGYNLVTFPDPVYCGRISDGKGWRLLQPFKVNGAAHNGFQNVVVLIKGIKKGKAFDNTTKRIEAIDCLFEPYITVVKDRQEVEIVNMDPVMHDIQAYETSHLGARVLFNVPLPMSERLQRRKDDLLLGKVVKNRAGKVMTQEVKMRKGRDVFVMQCGFHAYMESWGLVVDNPYFDISSGDGTYSIGDIPPGTYKVIAWHPLVTQDFTVTIQPGERSRLDIIMEAPKGRLYANEAQENTRFGMELLGGSEIKPIVRLQKR